MQIKQSKGFTLIELLCVIAIVAILLGLLLTAVSKARRYSEIKIFRAESRNVKMATQVKLENFYEGKTNFPAWTAKELYDKEVFDQNILNWMSEDMIRFYPFSSSDSNNATVMVFYFTTDKATGVRSWLVITKEDIMNQTFSQNDFYH